jgi:HTH-type transcriptional regulator / antitoxin HipB
MLFLYNPVRDHNFIAFPFGIIHTTPMTLFTPHRIGQIIKAYRLEQKLTQAELAHLSGTGLRFIVELERGKPTVQLGKMLQVMGALGLEIGVSRAGAGKPATAPYAPPIAPFDPGFAMPLQFANNDLFRSLQERQIPYIAKKVAPDK